MVTLGVIESFLATPARLNEFLNSTELFETQKDEIRSAPPDKVALYTEATFWHRLHTVKQACANLHNSVARCGSSAPRRVACGA
jgi:hypothetical protein